MSNININNNNIINDPTRCPTCHDPFSSDPPHRPKILPCGHTTCESCIAQWANRNNPLLVQCPHCGKHFDALKNVNDESVPVNYTLLGVIDMMKRESELRLKEKKKTESGWWKWILSFLFFWCRQPSPAPPSSSPPPPSRVDEEDIQIDEQPSSPPKTCPHHTGLPLTIHCWSCYEDVCDRCVLLGHKTHSYTEIAAAHQIKTNPDKLRKMVDEWKTINNDLVATNTWMKSEEEELLKITDQMCNEMRDAVEKERIAMKQRVADVMQHRREEWSTMMAEVEKQIGEGEKVVGWSEELMMETVNNDDRRRGNKKNGDDDGDDVVVVDDWNSDDETKNKKNDNRDDVVDGNRAKPSLAQRAQETERAVNELTTFHNDNIEKMYNKIAKVQDEQDRMMKISMGKMEEATMMMEEGLRGVMTRAWNAFECDDDDVEVDEVDDNEDDGVEAEGGSDDDAAFDKEGNAQPKSRLETKREKIRDLMNEPLTISDSVKCEKTVFGVAWSHDGKSLFCSSFDGIHQIDAASGKTIKTLCKDAVEVYGLSLSKSGHLYACNYFAHKVHVISESSGEIIRTIGSTQGSGDGQFDWPGWICAVDEWDEVYVADQNNNRVQVFSMSDGHFIRKFGSEGKKLANPFEPAGVAVDVSEGLIFVSDCNNHCIRVFNREGHFVRNFGSFGLLNHPHDAAVDTAKKQLVFCDDNDGGRICVFGYDGEYIGCAKFPALSYVSMNADRRLAIASYSEKVHFAQLE